MIIMSEQKLGLSYTKAFTKKFFKLFFNISRDAAVCIS